MCELRAHPYFIALPPPSHYIPPSTAAELRQFREGSPQWCAAHLGRITTSACASCVGLYEERSAEMLGVPPSLRGHGKALDAQARIAQPALGLAEVAAAAEDVPTRSEFEGEERKEAEARAVWHTPDDPSSGPLLKFSRASLRHKWGPLCTPHPRARRELEGASLGRIRLAWGSRQEPTSILAALNYLCRLGAMIEEAVRRLALMPTRTRHAARLTHFGRALFQGLHPLEAIPPAERGALPAGLPPLGASPDACVRWADGRVEPFEVKNHAPFAARRAPKGSAHQSGAPPLEVRDPGPYDEVAVWHVPQLYLQMLCLGQACHSALFMSCSATRGANLFRLHRHEPTMQRLLGFVARFATQFGGGRPPPPENYFWSDEHRDECAARASPMSISCLLPPSLDTPAPSRGPRIVS
jgi:hypothetical protein